MQRETFINEAGNQIEIEVRHTNAIIGGGVHVAIDGPTSISTNDLTRMEAERLHVHLGAYLEATKR